MSAWSEFCKKYALENGITYTEASKLPEVKELYKLKKTEELKEQTAIFEEKLEAAIVAFEAETLAELVFEPIEIIEPVLSEVAEVLEVPIVVAGELPEDETVTVTYELAPPTPPLKSKIFVAKPKRVKSTKKLA
jgi:hypothetical protein